MTAWDMPPKAKIYEALTALADGRVRQTSPTEAEVISSGGDKTYHVRWSPDGQQFTSDDPASHWQGYMGYPIVAVLLSLGRVPYDPSVAAWLAGIRWRRLNDQFRRDYDRAVEAVLDQVQAAGHPRSVLEDHVEKIYERLAQLGIARGPRTAAGRRRGSPHPPTREPNGPL